MTSLILPNLPNKCLCGIDLLSFTTSPHFLGVKLLPLGWHFVFIAANDFSIRQGIWFEALNARELHLKEWNPNTEELSARSDVTTVERWQSRLADIWHERLTPYRQSVPKPSSENELYHEEEAAIEEHNDWLSLTDCITSHLLGRITGVIDSTSNHYSLTSASSAKQDFDTIPGITAFSNSLEHESELGLLPINLKQTWPDGAIGRERTEAAKDRSWALQQLIQVHCNGNADELLGELQFTFLMVLTLNNNSCLEQWRRILGLLLTCSQAVIQESVIFIRFLKLLKTQLEHSADADVNLFDLSEEGGASLKALLARFRKGLEDMDPTDTKMVVKELESLEDHMKAEYGWDLNTDHLLRGVFELEDGERVELDLKGADEEYETGEYGPLVVDLSPDQIKQLSK